MSRPKIEQGRRYCCQVLDNHDQLAGTFAITGGDIRLSLVSFGRFLSPDNTFEQVRVRTEEGWVASMFDLVPMGWTQHGTYPDVTYVRQVISNTTLIGADSWSDDDAVRRVSFRIPGADELFEHSPLFRRVMDADIFKMPDLTAFEVTAADMTVKTYFSPSGDLISRRPRHVRPWFQIAFSIGLSLADMRHAVDRVVQFLSCCAGRFLRATDVTVSRYTEAERLARVEARESIPEHRVHHFDDEDAAAGKASIYRALVDLSSEEGWRTLESGLAAWITRDADWSAASAMMMNCLSMHTVMSPDRLLSATRWFEETPTAQPRDVISKEHARALGKLVGKHAAKLGYGAVAGRFKNAVSRIALESNRDRFGRLVGEVRAVFGPDIVGDDMVDWLVEAFAMRGQAAHGARSAIDDEHELFACAVFSLEWMDMLLMLKDLPLSCDALARAVRHPLIAQYNSSVMRRVPKDVRVSS